MDPRAEQYIKMYRKLDEETRKQLEIAINASFQTPGNANQPIAVCHQDPQPGPSGITRKRTQDQNDDGFVVPKRHSKDKRTGTTTHVIPTQNRFDVIPEEEMEPTTTPVAKTSRLPPPIVLRNKQKWMEAARKMDQGRLHFNKAKTIQDGITLQPATSDDFRGITKLFQECKYEYHTYTLQEEKPLKAVLRGLPIDLPTEEIKDDLLAQGLPIEKISRMSDRNKRPMPLFLIQLKRTSISKQVFNLTNVCHLQIKVESPRSRPTTSQCHRCQRFHHAQGNCHATPRCVKCGKDHHTAVCTKPRDEPATCANCQQAHPANYRGCPAFPKVVTRHHAKPTPQHPTRQPSTVKPSISFADSVKGAAVQAAPVTATTTQPAPETAPTAAIQPTPPTVEYGQQFALAAVISKMMASLTSAKTTQEVICAVFSCLPDILQACSYIIRECKWTHQQEAATSGVCRAPHLDVIMVGKTHLREAGILNTRNHILNRPSAIHVNKNSNHYPFALGGHGTSGKHVSTNKHCNTIIRNLVDYDHTVRWK